MSQDRSQNRSQNRTKTRRRFALRLTLLMTTACAFSAATFADAEVSLLSDAELIAPPDHLQQERWRAVRVDGGALEVAAEASAPAEITIDLFDGQRIAVRHRRTIDNESGSFSWIGDVSGRFPPERRRASGRDGLVVLVHRAGVTLGSIRLDDAVYMLAYGGGAGGDVHVLYEVDESLPKYREDEPTPAVIEPRHLEAARQRAEAAARAGVPGDDGAVQDLLVVYSIQALSAVGGQVAMENLVDLGVTETHLSYETSGINHRLRLVGTMATDYDESIVGQGCPRDLLQNPNDGVMDEVHDVRDQVAADLVKLITANTSCGRAFRMDEISTAHAEFAFCYTRHVCVSPGYTFQHELGHIQGARHQHPDPEPDSSPFTFNHGYFDAENRFRTIMAAGDNECPGGCPRRLAWSNPDVLDAETGAAMGIAEGEPLPTDNRKTLNATASVVANFRVSGVVIFNDDFESGNLSAWSQQAGAGTANMEP